MGDMEKKNSEESNASVFTQAEIDYLGSQRLGRLATVGPDGQPHNVPNSFRYNPETDTIDLGGLAMDQTKKWRDVGREPRVSFVVDDVLPPWQPRMIEIRGLAERVHTGGSVFGPHFAEPMIRIRPTRILSFGLEGEARTLNARNVGGAREGR